MGRYLPHPQPRRRADLGRHARVDFRTGTPLLVAEMLIAWAMWRDGESVNEIGRHIGRTRTATRSMLFGAAAPLSTTITSEGAHQ